MPPCRVVLLALLFAARTEAAPSFTVNSIADEPATGDLANGVCETAAGNGTCTLRAAVMKANHYPGGGVTIVLPANFYLLYNGPGQPGAEAVGDLDLTAAMTLQGAGADRTVIDATGLGTRVMHVTAAVELEDLAVMHGRRSGETGGIFNEGTLTLRRVRVAYNQALGFSGNDVFNGGGLYNTGTLTVIESSIDHNRGGFGGALLNYGNGASASFLNSTIGGNLGAEHGAIENYQGDLSLQFSTVAGNACTDCGLCTSGTTTIYSSDVVAVKASLFGDNLGCGSATDFEGLYYDYGYTVRPISSGWTSFGDPGSTVTSSDPLLRSPAPNPGSTPTRALQAGSVALDRIPPADCVDLDAAAVTRDQRGATRPAGASCDVGAHEGSVPSSLFGRNLVRNGDSEVGVGSYFETAPLPVPYWTALDAQPRGTVVPYCLGNGTSSQDCTPVASLAHDSPGPANRGATFFAGGMEVPDAYLTQVIDLAPIAAQIATGQVGFEFSAFLGGYTNEADDVEAALEARNAGNTVVQVFSIGPVTPAERGNSTGLLRRRDTAALDPSVQSLRVTLHFHRATGLYNNGYADNVSVVLSTPPPPLFADSFEDDPAL